MYGFSNGGGISSADGMSTYHDAARERNTLNRDSSQ